MCENENSCDVCDDFGACVGAGVAGADVDASSESDREFLEIVQVNPPDDTAARVGRTLGLALDQFVRAGSLNRIIGAMLANNMPLLSVHGSVEGTELHYGVFLVLGDKAPEIRRLVDAQFEAAGAVDVGGSFDDGDPK